MARPPNPNPRQDIHAVAKAANVSIATVSRVINEKASVRPALAKRVWMAIEKLDYHPNHGARAMVSGRSRTIGLIVSRITNPFFPELIEGFEQVAAEQGFEILLSSVGPDGGGVEALVQRMLHRNAEGVAVMTHGLPAAGLQRFAVNGTPMVFLDAQPAVGLGDAVQLDYEKGFREAIQHLAILGHRRIAFISGNLDRYTARLRQQAFVRAMKEIGVADPLRLCVEGDHTAEGGQKGLTKLLEMTPTPTAVLCSNDMTAIGALGAAREANIKVPEDLSIVGFDDIQLTRFIYPALTTISVDRNALARRSFNTLMKRISEPQSPAVEDLFPTTLVVRQSSSYAAEVKREAEPSGRRAVRRSKS